MKKSMDELMKRCEELGIINIETAGELSENLINDVISSTENLLNSFDLAQIANEVNRREEEVKAAW